MPDNTTPPTVSLQVLAEAGREPALPAVLPVDFGELTLRQALRVLPGRRLTARATLAGEAVIAKLFFDHPKSLRDAAQEAERLATLAERGVPAPRVLGDSGVGPSGRILVLECLPGSDAEHGYRKACLEGDGAALLVSLTAFVARLHEAGCVQDDVHLGNFLIDGEQYYLVDAGSVRLFPLGQMPESDRLANLAGLLAQFYPLDTRDLEPVLAAYGDKAPPKPDLTQALTRARQRRYRHALGKVERDCTDYAVVRYGALRGMVCRQQKGAFQALLEAGIDAVMEQGEILKRGNSSTVCRVRWQGHEWVVKRYNVKSLGHRLRRQFKPSRASRSWRNARWLELIGLHTPPAVGYVERRVAGFLDTAYFVCGYVSGPSVRDLAGDATTMRAVQARMEQLFFLMETLHFNHGDLKATNFLWIRQRLWVLDLDAMQLNLSLKQTRKLVARDRARWREN